MVFVQLLQQRVWPWASLVGIAAASISLLRLWLGNRMALGENLWAEDGLFPLCIHKANFWECLVDPFAGYLLFLPRVLAWPTSLLSAEWWGWSANVLGAFLAGVVAGLVMSIMKRARLGWFVSTAAALLPVVAPMAGLEAINSIGSSYMLLLYLSTVAILFLPQRSVPRSLHLIVASLLLVTSLTIPSAIVLLALVAVQFGRRVISGSCAAWWLGALLIGLSFQAIVALTAPSRRAIEVSSNSLQAWADSVPTSLLTFWPGMSLGEFSFLTNFSFAPSNATGLLVVIVLIIIGMSLTRKGWSSPQSMLSLIGLLLLAGLGFGLIPSVIGYANNRYFVVPVLLWGVAALVAFDPLIRRSGAVGTALAVSAVAVIWWPALPASSFRSTPAPLWSAEVERIEAQCRANPNFIERPIFSPFWPPNWGDGLDEPSHPNFPCGLAPEFIR